MEWDDWAGDFTDQYSEEDLQREDYGDYYDGYNWLDDVLTEEEKQREDFGDYYDYSNDYNVEEIANPAMPGQEGYGWRYFSDGTAISPTGDYFFDNKEVKYKNFIMQGHPDKLDALHKLLNQHDITSHQLTKNTTVKGYDYQKQGNTTSNFSEQALVVSTKQPKGKMVQVLLEPQTKLNDSLTYDITAWSLPYAYGLEAMATQSDLNISDYTIEKTTTSKLSEALYGYALSYNSFEDSRFLAALLKENIGVRFNETPLTNSGKSWTRGSLFILKGDNQKLPNYLEKLAQLASDFNRKLTPIQTGYSSQGPDLGAGELILIKAPKIAILKNDRTSSYNYGEVWHYFEQALGYPLLQLDENSLTTALNHIDQLIIPDGYYSQ